MEDIKQEKNLSLPNKLVLLFLGLILFISWSMQIDFQFFPQGLTQYLPIHTLTELFSIVVSILAFTIAWENKAKKKYVNTMIVSVIFFWLHLSILYIFSLSLECPT